MHRNFLIISPNTKNDTDWVPYEIEYGVDNCKLPIIAAYVDFEKIKFVISPIFAVKNELDATYSGTTHCSMNLFRRTQSMLIFFRRNFRWHDVIGHARSVFTFVIVEEFFRT